MLMNPEKVIIFCAPSGSGKTTIVKHLLQVNNQLMFSVSACTRSKRTGEVDGKDYYFLSKDAFQQKIKQDEFLEYEEVYGGNFYGTLKSEINRIWDLGKVVLFDVDVVGGLKLKEYFGNKALAIFVKPPSIQVLEERLRFRSTETDETLKMRVDKAVNELRFESKFEEVLLNDDLKLALAQAELLVNHFINN
jgi:guanylate kinase